MTITGSCEFSAVMLELSGKLRDSTACHCTQCHKTLGHSWAANSVLTEQLKLFKSKSLKCYRSSGKVHRRFCTGHGSSGFFQPDRKGCTAVGASTLDGATGLHKQKHNYIKSKGYYFCIAEDATQLPTSSTNGA